MDKIERWTWWVSPEHQKEQRKQGRVLNFYGGYSTREEIQDFLNSLRKRKAELLGSLDEKLKDCERDLRKF